MVVLRTGWPTPRRLVWLAEVPYVGLPHRQPILARLLAERFETLYVEPPPTARLPRPDVIAHDRLRVAQVAPLLNAHQRVLRVVLADSRVRAVAARLGTWQLKRALRKLGWERRPSEIAVVCSNVFMAPAVRELRPGLYVMDLCDDPRNYPGEPRWTGSLLESLAHSVDIATTSSRALLKELRTMGARQAVFLPNGISDDLLRAGLAFSRDRPGSRGRVVGFVGYFGSWVDFELLERLAVALPGKILRLVGPADPAVREQLKRVLGKPGVEYVPLVPHAEIPGVLAAFDVGIIPFRVTPYTHAVNPVKLYEYAAFNLPIVSTAFSPDVAEFAPAVDIARNTDEFVRLVEVRLDGQSLPKTRWIAEAHTWSSVAHTLAVLFENGRSTPRIQIDGGRM